MSNSAIPSTFAKLLATCALVANLSMALLSGEASGQDQEPKSPILWARQVEQGGNLAEAQRLYERVLATDLTSQEAHHRLGVLAAQRGELNRAIQHFTTAQGLGQPTVQLLNDFGGTLCLKGDLAAAQEKLRQALLIDPESQQARNNLEFVITNQRKRAQAQSAALVREIAEMRAAAETRAAVKAIADAQIASRVRKLAEARAAAETKAAVLQIDRLKQSKPGASKVQPRAENPVSQVRHSSIKMVSGSRAGYDRAVQQAANPSDTTWRRAQALLAQGKTSSALEAIEAALRNQPQTARYLLTKARCLADQAEFAQAKSIAKSVETSPQAAPEEKAQALAILGRLTLESGSQNAAGALKMYIQAIKLAQPLIENSNPAIRHSAQAVQIEANLGVAHSIGRGRWNRKSTAVPIWIGRAEQLAKTMVEREGSPLGLRLQVIEGALRAYSSFEPAISPERHLREAEVVASEIWSKSNDPTDKPQAEWRLGLIYVHAIKLTSARKESDQANQYAQRARKYLEKSAGGRSSSHRARYELAKAYYWMGTAAASSGNDREKSLDWYTRSAALLASKGKHEAFYPTDAGNALVTMGNKFWQAKLTQKAVETTEAGTNLLQDAVDQGSKDLRSLNQAHARLTEMQRELGQKLQADATAKKATLIR